MKRDESIVNDVSCLAIAGFFAIGLILLGVRLKEVQVDGAADYGYANVRQSERRVQTVGGRGRIVDRNGVVLAGNRETISIVCDVAHFQRKSWAATATEVRKAIANLEKVVGGSSPLTDRAIRRHVNQSLAMPLTVFRDVDLKTLAKFAENEWRLKGFSCLRTKDRTYPNGSLAAHLLGYVGKDRAETVAGDEKFNFYDLEMRGRSGLEVYYDSFMRGVPGEKRILVDARGFAIDEWTVTKAQKGPDLELAIDIELQRAVEKQLKGERGGCAVIDPRNGEVLALASSPGFDPNDFVPSLSKELYDAYANDPAKPLLNRASGGSYAPGSTFKPITALAGLLAGYSATDKYECVGVFTMGSMHLRCARRWGHGQMDMRNALKESCNPYFCNLGVSTGTNLLMRTALAFGLGAKTGLDLGVDAAGVVPDADWKLRTYKEHWYPGDLAQMSIGQGMLLVSPLQMARVAGAIATGKLVTPHLKRDIEPEFTPLPFSRNQLAVVREGMRMVVDGGSGKRGGEGLAVSVAGKTGTAEVGIGERRRKNTWFIAYAPVDAPRLAIAMVIENGMSGGATTAPKVREVLKVAFGERGDG